MHYGNHTDTLAAAWLSAPDRPEATRAQPVEFSYFDESSKQEISYR